MDLEGVIPIKIGELGWRTSYLLSINKNERTLQEELDMLDEDINIANLNEAVVEERMTIKYNKKVKPCKLEIDDLVL